MTRCLRRPLSTMQGFTLVELMVIVILVGILSGISIVTFNRNWRDERVKAATRETSAWLDEVRRIAIQKAIPCRIRIDQTNTTLELDPNPVNLSEFCASTLQAPLNLRAKIQNSGDLLLCSADLDEADPANYSLSCSTPQGGSSSLVFTPRGTITGGLLIKFHMQQVNTDRCIAVMAPLGQIRSGRATSSGCDFTTAY